MFQPISKPPSLRRSAARTDPKSLAGKIRQRKQHFKGKDYYPPEHSGKVAVASKEEVAVVDEALRFLEKQPALSADSSK